MRADLFLVEHGFATTRSQAQRLIASGVQWRVMVDTEVDAPWKRVAKNGDEVPDNAELEVLDNTEAKYISRGGLKLEGALKRTGLNVTGLRCLDIGQSTGGFTDCLLQHGAAQVVGVDVGGTRIKAVAMARHGLVKQSRVIATLGQAGPKDLEATIVGVVRALASQCGGLRAVGVGLPGAVNPEQGVVMLPGRLDRIAGYPLVPRLRQQKQERDKEIEAETK